MSRSIKDRRQKGVKRRNPIARALRAAAFRARQEANRRRYSRKLKHKPKPDADPD